MERDTAIANTSITEWWQLKGLNAEGWKLPKPWDELKQLITRWTPQLHTIGPVCLHHTEYPTAPWPMQVEEQMECIQQSPMWPGEYGLLDVRDVTTPAGYLMPPSATQAKMAALRKITYIAKGNVAVRHKAIHIVVAVNQFYLGEIAPDHAAYKILQSTLAMTVPVVAPIFTPKRPPPTLPVQLQTPATVQQRTTQVDNGARRTTNATRTVSTDTGYNHYHNHTTTNPTLHWHLSLHWQHTPTNHHHKEYSK